MEQHWRRSINLPYAGWLPHERFSSRAYLELAAGVGANLPKGLTRIALTFAPPPAKQPENGEGYAVAGLTSLPIAQMKPESSRAIAVTTTVGFLPSAVSLR